jgi:hypothetical protein
LSAHEYVGGERIDSLLELVGRTLPDGQASQRGDTQGDTPGLRSIGHDPTRDDDGILPIPTMHHARAQLARVEQVLLAMWSSRMPDLGDGATERLCAAHRAVHEAMLLLDDERVIADTGELPLIR